MLSFKSVASFEFPLLTREHNFTATLSTKVDGTPRSSHVQFYGFPLQFNGNFFSTADEPHTFYFPCLRVEVRAFSVTGQYISFYSVGVVDDLRDVLLAVVPFAIRIEIFPSSLA
ncbi:hypothetical protein [Dipodfec virus UOA04_Rod_567]|nr:hypothetical protein [Dipodfec virus UOA04_Rod_567]